MTAEKGAPIERVESGGGLSPHCRGAGHVAEEGDLAEPVPSVFTSMYTSRPRP